MAPSATVLVYSFALLPFYFAATAVKRRLMPIVLTAVIPIIVAVGPALISRQEAQRYYKAVSTDDVSRLAEMKPKTIELEGDLQSGMFPDQSGKNAPIAICNSVCRSLLYNDEVDRVRMKEALGEKTYYVTYRHVHQDACPNLLGIELELAVSSRLAAGDVSLQRTTFYRLTP